MAFYDEMANMVSDLLKPDTDGGLGQGKIELTRTTPGTVDKDKPWLPVTPTTKTLTIKGVVRGVSKELIGTELGGSVIIASDRVAITEVPSMVYTAGDVLSVDGKPVHILAVENIPAAGAPSAVRFTIRG